MVRIPLFRGSVCFALAIPLALGQAVDTSDRDYWNSKFKDPNAQFNRQPSRLLADVVRNRKPGLAVDLGMGEGRNAIYLAQHGWQVTGVDLSDVAVAQAKKRAAVLQVNLAAIVDRLDHYDFGKDKWDLISLFYLHAWYHNVISIFPSSASIIMAVEVIGLVMDAIRKIEFVLSGTCLPRS